MMRKIGEKTRCLYGWLVGTLIIVSAVLGFYFLKYRIGRENFLSYPDRPAACFQNAERSPCPDWDMIELLGSITGAYIYTGRGLMNRNPYAGCDPCRRLDKLVEKP